MQRALVVGATGMLAGVCTGLAIDNGMTVGAIARTKESLNRLGAVPPGIPGKLIPMALDYHDIGRLKHWIAHFQLMEGPIDLVVAWMHEPWMASLEAIVAEVEAYRHMPWRLVHVVGSGTALETLTPPVSGSWCQYQRVTLGFVVEASTSRWLTHSEICQGVLQSIRRGQPASVVGTLEPWHRRP